MGAGQVLRPLHARGGFHEVLQRGAALEWVDVPVRGERSRGCVIGAYHRLFLIEKSHRQGRYQQHECHPSMSPLGLPLRSLPS